MQLTPMEILSVALPVVAVIVWLIRLEGQVARVDQQQRSDMRLLAQQREADLQLSQQRLDAIDEKLDGIRSSVDRLDGMRAKVDRISSFISGQSAGSAS